MGEPIILSKMVSSKDHFREKLLLSLHEENTKTSIGLIKQIFGEKKYSHFNAFPEENCLYMVRESEQTCFHANSCFRENQKFLKRIPPGLSKFELANFGFKHIIVLSILNHRVEFIPWLWISYRVYATKIWGRLQLHVNATETNSFWR